METPSLTSEGLLISDIRLKHLYVEPVKRHSDKLTIRRLSHRFTPGWLRAAHLALHFSPRSQSGEGFYCRPLSKHCRRLHSYFNGNTPKFLASQQKILEHSSQESVSLELERQLVDRRQSPMRDFYGCYLLVSRSENAKGRTYIG